MTTPTEVLVPVGTHEKTVSEWLVTNFVPASAWGLVAGQTLGTAIMPGEIMAQEIGAGLRGRRKAQVHCPIAYAITA